jgi:hypothetical protein
VQARLGFHNLAKLIHGIGVKKGGNQNAPFFIFIRNLEIQNKSCNINRITH